MDAIEKSKHTSLSRFLFAIGIRHVGEVTAQLLAKRFKSIDRFMKASRKELEATEGIGPEVADSIVKWLADGKNRDMIQRLIDAGVDIEPEEGEGKSLLAGLNFVFTGSLEHLKRAEAKKAVAALGGQVQSTVGKRTDYVVAGKDPGSKIEKAKKLGINIISEQEFMDMIRQD